MPQLEPWSYASQIFWLIVTFAVLFLVLWKVVIPRITSVLEARREKIEDDLARAERLKLEAEQVLAEYNKALDEARSEAQGMLREAADQMAADAGARNDEVTARLAEQNRAAESRIDEARRQALEAIRPAAAEVAAAALTRLVGSAPAAARVEQAVADAASRPRAAGG